MYSIKEAKYGVLTKSRTKPSKRVLLAQNFLILQRIAIIPG
jgi:hypothetical protein